MQCQCGAQIVGEAFCTNCGRPRVAQQFSQPQYAPMSDFQAQPPQKTNGMAIAGFVTAITCCSPIGIVLSSIGISQISKDPTQKGKGLATAGLIIGIVGLIFSILGLLG